MTRTLSKLQIRSEVLSILSEFVNLEDTPKFKQDEILKNLRLIENKSDLLDFLLKELPKLTKSKAQIVIYLIIELGSLEELKEPLWALIKSSNSSDELKDLVSIALRSLGDDSETSVFLEYLDDPKAIIDKETQKLLELAKVNPEAQIDFFDFLFSLPEQEQLYLINSLEADYLGENLINILVPALETNPSDVLKEALINALGKSKNEGAVSILNEIYCYNFNEKHKKLAKKNLNLLRLMGIDIEKNITDRRGKTICELTEVYECYASNIDGVGNQGFVISRIRPNQDIMMFTVVVNDIMGIVDCFGFNGISKTDFSRIIQKFQEKSTRLRVSPEYCKQKLKEAENINKNNNSKIAYEYVSWKILTNDFKQLDKSIEKVAEEWGNITFISQGHKLYNYPDFKYWFLEEADQPKLVNFLNEIISNTVENIDFYLKNTNEYLQYLNNKINIMLPTIFDENLKKYYKNRLLNIAYLLDLQGLNSFRNITSSVAISLDPVYDLAILENPFFIELMKKTISEAFLRHRQKITDYESSLQSKSQWNLKMINSKNQIKPQGDYSKINEIIVILFEEWMIKITC